MSDQMDELLSRVARLEGRLAAAASEVQRLRVESAQGCAVRRVMTVIIGMIAVAFWAVPGGVAAPLNLNL